MLDEHFASMHKEAQPGPHVRLRVRDTGTGIPDSVKEHLFESFFTTKGEARGTGLGLTTVRGIVRNHKGFISFTSAVGQGTTFEVHLPASLESKPSAQEQPSRSTIPHGHGELVLVVDDEAEVRAAIRRTLRAHGYDVLEAGDGIQALAEFSTRQSEVRAVVTDVVMPLMDGVTLCRTLRVLAPALPILVSSGGLFDKQEHGREVAPVLKELGVRHILAKPHTGEALLRTLAQALSSQQSNPSHTP
jgi:CheY-like chemotaxis protein